MKSHPTNVYCDIYKFRILHVNIRGIRNIIPNYMTPIYCINGYYKFLPFVFTQELPLMATRTQMIKKVSGLTGTINMNHM